MGRTVMNDDGLILRVSEALRDRLSGKQFAEILPVMDFAK